MERRLELLALGCFLLLPLSLCWFPIVNHDLGFHLRAGEWIFTHGSIPTQDPFSYTAEGRPWVDSHWLFQLLLFGVYEAAGLPGLVLLRALFVVATFAFVLAVSWRPGALVPSIVVGALAVFASFGRFWLRPELASLLLLAVFFFLAERAPRWPRATLAGVVACQVLWVNLHGLHLLGVGFLALYFLGDWIQSVAGGPEARARTAPGPRLALAAGAALALLANANGWAGMTYPLDLLRELRAEVSWFPRLAELRPPHHFIRWVVPDPVLAYFALIGLSAAALLASPRRIRLAHLLPYLAFLYLSLLAVRNAPLFAVVAAPIAIRSLTELQPARLETRGARRAAALASLVGVAGLVTAVASGAVYRQLELADRRFAITETARYPAEMVEHLRTREGNVWNSSDLGGYLIWKLWPEKQVGIDGRWEVYGSLLPELRRAYADPAAFDRLAARYDIRAVLLGRHRRETRAMLRWLAQREDWRLTMRGPRALLFERQAPEPGA